MPSADITKRAIADTMKKLMDNTPLAKISISDIVNACGMTRNSFYYHFKDKFDLVNWIFYTEITDTLGHLDAENLSSLVIIEELCRFFYNDRIFYQNALTVTGQNSFIEYFDQLLQQLIASRVADIYKDDEDLDFLVMFFSNAMVITISRWIKDGTEIPPEKVAGLIKKAATGTAIRISEDERLAEEELDT